MTRAKKRKPYDIWECTRCGQRCEREQLQPDPIEWALAKAWDCAGGEPALYHKRYEVRGSGRQGVIGSRTIDVVCGPVVQRTVGMQEQLIEWLTGAEATDAR